MSSWKNIWRGRVKTTKGARLAAPSPGPKSSSAEDHSQARSSEDFGPGEGIKPSDFNPRFSTLATSNKWGEVIVASVTPMTWTNNRWQAATTDTTKRCYYSPIQPNNVSSIALLDEVLIWPQPANDFIQVDAKGITEISMIDVTGKISKRPLVAELRPQTFPTESTYSKYNKAEI